MTGRGHKAARDVPDLVPGKARSERCVVRLGGGTRRAAAPARVPDRRRGQAAQSSRPARPRRYRRGRRTPGVGPLFGLTPLQRPSFAFGRASDQQRVHDRYLSGDGNCFSHRRDRRSVRDVLERPPLGFFAQDQNRQRRDHEGTSAERKHAALASRGQDQADDRWADQRTDAADC
jgi:hypothetical protein